VRHARPDVGLTIAGDRPARSLRRLAASAPAISVTGRVSALAPLLSSCGVAVAPLFAGSGQLLKMLEAFACATPVVATSLAVAGLELQHERHVLVADSAADFAAHVLRVLGDPVLQARIGAAGREVAECHTWEQSVAGLERIYAEVAPAGA
jgi:glycosyltransferase involved in cell wall biosynthesis